MHLIVAGMACRHKTIENGARQIVGYLLPGDFCDLHVFILDQMDHTISTLTECAVVDLPRETVLRLTERPAIAARSGGPPWWMRALSARHWSTWVRDRPRSAWRTSCAKCWSVSTL